MYRPVNGRQHIGIALRAGRKKQRSGLEDDAGIHHPILGRMEIAEQVVGDDRIGIAPLHHHKGIHETGGIHQRNLNAKTVHHAGERGALHRTPEHSHPLALQVKQRMNRAARRAIDL